MMSKNRAAFAVLIFCVMSALVSAPLTAQQEEKKKEIENLTRLVDKLNEERLKYKKEKEDLYGEFAELKENFNIERSTLYAELGDNYTKSKLFSQAIKAYSKALELNPKNAEVHYNLALIYKYSQGDVDRAVEHLQYYLKLAPDPKRRKDAEYLLDTLRANRISPYE